MSKKTENQRLILPCVLRPTDVDFGSEAIRLLPNQAIQLGPKELAALAAAGVVFEELTPKPVVVPAGFPKPAPKLAKKASKAIGGGSPAKRKKAGNP